MSLSSQFNNNIPSIERRKGSLRRFYERTDPGRIKNIDPLFSHFKFSMISEAIQKKYKELPEGWEYEPYFDMIGNTSEKKIVNDMRKKGLDPTILFPDRQRKQSRNPMFDTTSMRSRKGSKEMERQHSQTTVSSRRTGRSRLASNGGVRHAPRPPPGPPPKNRKGSKATVTRKTKTEMIKTTQVAKPSFVEGNLEEAAAAAVKELDAGNIEDDDDDIADLFTDDEAEKPSKASIAKIEAKSARNTRVPPPPPSYEAADSPIRNTQMSLSPKRNSPQTNGINPVKSPGSGIKLPIEKSTRSTGTAGENVDLSKYRKMKQAGLPDGAVKNAMVRDGLDAALFEKIGDGGAGGVVSFGLPTGKIESKPMTAAVPAVPPPQTTKPAVQVPDGVDLSKYAKMKKAGLPDGAIINCMNRDGVDPSLFDAIDSADGAPTATTPAPVEKKVIPPPVVEKKLPTQISRTSSAKGRKPSRNEVIARATTATTISGGKTPRISPQKKKVGGKFGNMHAKLNLAFGLAKPEKPAPKPAPKRAAGGVSSKFASMHQMLDKQFNPGTSSAPKKTTEKPADEKKAKDVASKFANMTKGKDLKVLPIDSSEYDKYRRMQKSGLPEGAIRNCLERDGFDPEGFFNPKTPAAAAPKPAEETPSAAPNGSTSNGNGFPQKMQTGNVVPTTQVPVPQQQQQPNAMSMNAFNNQMQRGFPMQQQVPQPQVQATVGMMPQSQFNPVPSHQMPQNMNYSQQYSQGQMPQSTQMVYPQHQQQPQSNMQFNPNLPPEMQGFTPVYDQGYQQPVRSQSRYNMNQGYGNNRSQYGGFGQPNNQYVSESQYQMPSQRSTTMQGYSSTYSMHNQSHHATRGTRSNESEGGRSRRAYINRARSHSQNNAAPLVSGSAPNPNGWSVEWSEDYKRPYYFNRFTNESTWDPPPGM